MSSKTEFEISLEHAKKLVRRKDQIEKLTSNREFKAVVLEFLFKEEPARLVSALADPNMADYREELLADMDMISRLQQFFRHHVQIGTMAEREMADIDQMMDELEDEAEAE